MTDSTDPSKVTFKIVPMSNEWKKALSDFIDNLPKKRMKRTIILTEVETNKKYKLIKINCEKHNFPQDGYLIDYENEYLIIGQYKVFDKIRDITDFIVFWLFDKKELYGFIANNSYTFKEIKFMNNIIDKNKL